MDLAHQDGQAGAASDGNDADHRLWLIAGAALAGLLAYLGFLYRDSVASLVNVWYGNETYNHGFLIIPISLYLVWDRRHLFRQYLPQPQPWLAILFPILGFGWLIAEVASAAIGQHLMLILMIQLALFGVFGPKVYRAFLFPFAYLLFMLPVGEFLVPHLQDFTARFSVVFLQMLNIPVYIDGVFITIPNGRFEVAEACAGIRFLIASIAFGFLYANLVYRSFGRRLIFVGLSFVVPVIANGFRAFGIIIIAHLSDNELAVGVDHLVYGWFFFAFVLILLIWIGMAFREDNLPAPIGERPAAVKPTMRDRRAGGSIVITVMLAGVLATAAPAYALYIAGLGGSLATEAVPAPQSRSPWSVVARQSVWSPSFPGADAMLHRVYSNGERDVDLVIAYFARQRPGAEVISHHNRLYDGETWQRTRSYTVNIKFDGHKVPVTVKDLVGPGRRRIVLDFWWIDGGYGSGGVKAKIAQAKGELISGRRDAAAIVLSALYEDDPGAALKRIEDLLEHMAPIGPLLSGIRPDA
ncbi:Transmembrane exosortase (Exosortase_EpsH) [Oceanibacterium hippocampi]|uniref:Transmembrane exosortase (Exosortase_EpsH) n=1 Tax=Oceanibacterium hippocampi TaxID=745714 RepID=A0A1Y5TV51_9PROT|nr:Transmembrane exosortase (Exosortase_EpsH) [Oceanibacterium hippocampi]